MEQYIPKSALVAEIESLLDKSTYLEEYDCAYRDGNNGALYALKGKLDTLEVKEVDLKKEYKDFVEEDPVYNKLVNGIVGKAIAKHFFELGLSASNPTTAADRGTAEEIIINLKRVEQDYRIDLTREIEWLRNKVKKGD